MPPALQSPSDETAPPAPPAPEASAQTRQPTPPPDEPVAPPVVVVEIPAIEEASPIEVELAIEQPAPPIEQPISPPKPIAPPKASAPAISPDEDDPFAPAKPAPKPAHKPAPVDDDPFAPVPAKPAPARPTTATPAAGPLDMSADGQLPIREWVDDSGQFRTSGRLIAVLGDKVRILKETGRTTTVSMSRLSAADSAYVAEAIARHGIDLGEQLAAR